MNRDDERSDCKNERFSHVEEVTKNVLEFEIGLDIEECRDGIVIKQRLKPTLIICFFDMAEAVS